MPACIAADLGSIPGSGRFPGEGNGNPLQYSCLENPTDGGAWWAIVHRVAKSRIPLSDFTFTFTNVLMNLIRLLSRMITVFITGRDIMDSVNMSLSNLKMVKDRKAVNGITELDMTE